MYLNLVRVYYCTVYHKLSNHFSQGICSQCQLYIRMYILITATYLTAIRYLNDTLFQDIHKQIKVLKTRKNNSLKQSPFGVIVVVIRYF